MGQIIDFEAGRSNNPPIVLGFSKAPRGTCAMFRFRRARRFRKWWFLRGVFGWWVESRSCSCGPGGRCKSQHPIHLFDFGETLRMCFLCKERGIPGCSMTLWVTEHKGGQNHQGQWTGDLCSEWWKPSGPDRMLCKSHALYTVHPIFSLYCWFTLIPWWPGEFPISFGTFLLEKKKVMKFSFLVRGMLRYPLFSLWSFPPSSWRWVILGCTGWFNENHHTLVLSMMWIHGVKRQWWWWWWWWWWWSLLPPSLITTIKYMCIYIYILTYITTVTMIVIICFPFDIASVISHMAGKSTLQFDEFPRELSTSM